jgi:hypothetical protein
MNERIKELAEQCWDKRLDGLHFDQEKFAELIVRDCCPQRPWVGLTDEEVDAFVWNMPYEPGQAEIRAIEAALKDKNG